MPAARPRPTAVGGRQVRGSRPADPWQTIAPSALPFAEGWPAPRGDDADIECIREAFVASTQRAVRIGFDAIELHMAHGYLLHSFVSPISNQRNDEYGGELAARMRFPLEVARAVRAVVPKGCRSARASPAVIGSRAGSRPMTLWPLPRRLRRGLDFSAFRRAASAADQHPTARGFNVPLAERVKREAGIATRAVG